MSDVPIVPPARPVPWVRWIGSAVVAALLVWSVIGLDIKWSRLLEAPADSWRIAQLMFSNMEAGKIGDLLGQMGDSVAIAWLGTLLAAVVAVPMAFLAAENLAPRPVVWAVRLVFNLLRAVPEVILAIALVPIFGLTEKAGVLAIAIGSVGTLGKLCSEVLESIDPGPVESVDAVGASGLERLRWGVLPQSMPEIASFVLYRFEINIRASAVLGVIGAGGIGQALSESVRFKQWGTAGLALIIVVIVTMVIDTISGSIRRRLVSGGAGALVSPEAQALAENRPVEVTALG